MHESSRLGSDGPQPENRRSRRLAKLGLAVLACIALPWVVVDAVSVFAVPDLEALVAVDPSTSAYQEAAPPGLRPSAPLVWMPLEDVAPLTSCAVVASEDRFFGLHRGFDLGQIRQVVLLRLRGGKQMGASTITQQLARNLYLDSERSFRRKLHEALIARKLEATLDKGRILELYLNLVEWGPGSWGITEASRHYFAKRPADLTLPEGVLLASLLAAPRGDWSGANLERMRGVARRVLGQLHESELVSRDAANDAWQALARIDAAVAPGTALRAALELSSRRAESTGPRVAPSHPDVPRDGLCAARLQLRVLRACERDPLSHPHCPDPERDTWR